MVFRQLQSLKAQGKIGKGHGSLKSVLAVSVWDLCDAAPKIGATAADGTVVEASGDLLGWADPTELTNEHVNLQIGSVGSTTLRDETGALPDQAALRARYGPFLSLPMVVPINAYQSSLGYLAEEVKADITEDEDLIKGARTILTMLEKGEVVTREIARARIGTALSRRRFKLAWAIAATKVPDLKAPNRWQGL